MKRIILYCIIFAAVLLIPVEKLDVGKLEPVQAVWICRVEDEIILETDTEDKGRGMTVEAALADLEEHCLGIIYLDTAEFLLVSEDATDQIPMMRKHLKDSVEVCLWNGQGRVSDAAEYMASHENGLPIITLQTTNEKNVEKK